MSQNRQFQWFSDPTYIYPMVPSFAATMLKNKGHEVIWDDAIAEGLSYNQWLERINIEQPDIIVIESKTPVIKRHWQIIKDLNLNLKTVLVGDHVTALPEESMKNSPVDYVITGGDYDFVLTDLIDVLSQPQPQPSQFPQPASVSQPKPQPASPPMPQGIWYRDNNKIKNTGKPDLNHDFNSLPFIDRELTNWKQYAYKNGNFKYTPGTYIMAGRDCWWGKCSFCSWTTLHPGSTYRTVSPEHHVEEIGRLLTDYKVREIFDDSGCFPKGEWLEKFCEGIIKKGYHKKVTLGCNMRMGALSQDQCNLMKKAGFRFILIGLESMNQNTLDRLNKGVKVKQIEESLKKFKKAGLEPHITTMVGYPWETKEDAKSTINFARNMFLKGNIDTLQATIVVPYPGTPMFDEAKKNGWLLTENWEDYDMKQSVWKSPITNEDVLSFTQGLYKAALSPQFIMRKLFSIRNIDDMKFLFRAGSKVFSHLTDFRKR